jgi:hypothetical protein
MEQIQNSESSESCEEHNYCNNGDGAFYCSNCGLKDDDCLVDDTFDMMETSGSSGWRYNIRKNDDSSQFLFFELLRLGIPSHIIEKAISYYSVIITDKIYRAKNRYSIIFACVYYAYNDTNTSINISTLAKKFGLTKKKITGGLRKFTHVFKNKEIREDDIELIIHDIFCSIKFNVSENITDEIFNQLKSDVRVLFLFVKDLINEDYFIISCAVVTYYLKMINYPNQPQLFNYCELPEKKFKRICDKVDCIIGKKIFLPVNGAK